MRTIKIISRTERGKLAIQRGVLENYKIGGIEKAFDKLMGYRRAIISTNPYIYEIKIPKRFRKFVSERAMTIQIQDILLENGATVDIDYFIEVE